MHVVEIRDLTRVYLTGKRRSGKEEVIALDSVDLDIAEGQVHGLLGPNRAGKTTLVKILSTVLLPTSATARVLGFDVVDETEEVRKRVGLVFGGERGLYLRLTPRRILRYWAALYKLSDDVGIQRTEELIERVGLSEWADRRVETFSRGMKQRLHLARGLIADPPVLFLDEPTTGMDPVSAHDFRVLIGELRSEGRTVLLTTHDMAEAEAVCDRITLIDRGVILGTKTPTTVAEWLGSYERVENEYSLVQREAEETILPVCREEGIGFLAYSPSAGGLLTGKYRRGAPPPEGSLMALRPDMAEDIDDRVEELIAAVTEVAAAHDVSNVAVAFAWLLAQPAVTPIAGTSKPHHMEAIEQALDVELPDHDVKRLSSF